MTQAQAINLYQEITNTYEALQKAAQGLKKVARLMQKTQKIDPSQAWYWTKEWQEAEKKVDEDLKKGRYKTFDSVEKAIKYLDS